MIRLNIDIEDKDKNKKPKHIFGIGYSGIGKSGLSPDLLEKMSAYEKSKNKEAQRSEGE